jgi:hypothetical protein
MQLLNNTVDWRFKYIGFMTIQQMVEHVDDISHIDNIIPIILKDMSDPNPKIRFATLNCVSQISDQLNPFFQSNYHEKVIPCVLERIQDNVLRVQLQAYIESCTDQVATTYCQCFGSTFLSVLKRRYSVSLREAILNVDSELVTASDHGFVHLPRSVFHFYLNTLSISSTLSLTSHYMVSF